VGYMHLHSSEVTKENGKYSQEWASQANFEAYFHE
jgi:hypothetical protein